MEAENCELQEINLLPGKLLRMPSARIISDWYCESFNDILEFENSKPSVEVLSKSVGKIL